ncbi:MAG: protein of unknown function rane [Frankiales bacterium]|nr:protein of unknown function rane [Frankiales bacterium]
MKAVPLALTCKGLVSIVIGVVAVAWPHVTVHVFVIIFAVYAFTAAAAEAIRLAAARSALAVLGRLLLIVLDAIAGFAALRWPEVTTHVAIVIIAAWALVTGILELGFAVGGRHGSSERSLLALDGLIPIALGLVCAISPNASTITIAQTYALFSLIAGAAALAMAYDRRHDDDVPASIVRGGVL